MKGIYKSLSIVLMAVVFFFGYNKFIVDHSLEDLKSSLEMIANAESIEDAGTVKIALELLLLDRVTSRHFDKTELAALEHAYGVMERGAEVSSRELKDAMITVKQIIKRKIEERKVKRGPLVAALDRVNTGVVKGAKRVRDIPGTLTSKKDEGEKIDENLLAKAALDDKNWNLIEAKTAYEKLISTYPDYKEIKSVKLLLAYVYQKIGVYGKTEELLTEIVRSYGGTLEAETARKLLASIKKMLKLVDERRAISNKISHLTSKEEFQDAYFKLGTINTHLLDFFGAKDAFERVIELDPSSELAVMAQFNLAWGYKFQNKLKNSIFAFELLIQKYPESDLVLDAKCQLADIYRRQGQYEEAIARYEQIARDYKNNPIACQALIQASMIYFYDLNDSGKSEEVLLRIRKKYPAFDMAGKRSEYAQEVIVDERVAPTGIYAPISKAGARFGAEIIATTKRTKKEAVKFERDYSEKNLNKRFSNALKNTELEDNIRDLNIDLGGGKVKGSGVIKVGKLSVKGSGAAKVKALRGGFSFTLDDYKFTLGDSNIAIPIPKFLIERVMRELNESLTRKNLGLIVEEIIIGGDGVTIKGRGIKEKATEGKGLK